jgi:hypothetical protein
LLPWFGMAALLILVVAAAIYLWGGRKSGSA